MITCAPLPAVYSRDRGWFAGRGGEHMSHPRLVCPLPPQPGGRRGHKDAASPPAPRACRPSAALYKYSAPSEVALSASGGGSDAGGSDAGGVRLSRGLARFLFWVVHPLPSALHPPPSAQHPPPSSRRGPLGRNCARGAARRGRGAWRAAQRGLAARLGRRRREAQQGPGRVFVYDHRPACLKLRCVRHAKSLRVSGFGFPRCVIVLYVLVDLFVLQGPGQVSEVAGSPDHKQYISAEVVCMLFLRARPNGYESLYVLTHKCERSFGYNILIDPHRSTSIFIFRTEEIPTLSVAEKTQCPVGCSLI